MHVVIANLGFPFEVDGGENVPDIPGTWAIRNFTYLARGPCSTPIRKKYRTAHMNKNITSGMSRDDSAGSHRIQKGLSGLQQMTANARQWHYSLWCSDAISRFASCSTLTEVMGYSLMALIHFLGKCRPVERCQKVPTLKYSQKNMISIHLSNSFWKL